MKTMRTKNKRHFQLLELMIAMFILLICIAPTMRIFTSIYLSQHQMIRENQRDHLVHMAHAKFTQLLYERKIALDPDATEPFVVVLQDQELKEKFDKFSYAYVAKFIIKKAPKLKGQEKASKYLAQLTIEVNDLKSNSQQTNQKNNTPHYDYDIFISAEDKYASEDENEGESDSEDELTEQHDGSEEDEDEDESEEDEEEEDDS